MSIYFVKIQFYNLKHIVYGFYQTKEEAPKEDSKEEAMETESVKAEEKEEKDEVKKESEGMVWI